MNRLPDLLEDLAEADAVGHALRRFVEAEPRDPIATINLDAVMRRRRDLERELGALLGEEHHDLIRYRIDLFDRSAPPAAAVARSVLLFQSLVTAAFDAIRTAPKRLYQPSNENVRMSSLSFASVPGRRTEIHFTIPNERLLILESDLDITFGVVFELLAARAKTLFRNIAARAGIASVAAAYAWAENAAQHSLTTTITWRKASDERRTISLSHSDALLFKTAVEAITDDAVEPLECDCELISIDEAAATFRIENADGETISGGLADGFPRGGSWTTRRWYTAVLHRATRVRYATGEEIVRWSLRGLIAHD